MSPTVWSDTPGGVVGLSLYFTLGFMSALVLVDGGAAVRVT